MDLSNIPVQATLLALILMSLLTWTIGISKYRHSQALQTQAKVFLNEFWNSQSIESAEQLTKASQGDFACLAQSGYAAYAEYRANPASLKFYGEVNEVLRQPMRQTLSRILREQEKGLAILASIGSTAPFIGLFGTVWGIMDALTVIGAVGQASIDIVAGPIGEALIATAIGILTAIPAVMLYNFFLRRLKLRNTELEGFIEDVLRVLCVHASRTSATKGA